MMAWQQKSGPGNSNWNPEPTFKTVHHRLYRQRGAAKNHSCTDCGQPAHDWAFDEPTGFSADLDRYRPLCRKCHMADRALSPAVRLAGRPRDERGWLLPCVSIVSMGGTAGV